MAKFWRTIIASVLLSAAGTGCCSDCGCCDLRSWWRGDQPTPPPAQYQNAPPPTTLPAGNVTAPVTPRSPTGAYGGTGQ
jgi:hypothetical protein